MADDIVERLRAEVLTCPGRGNDGHGLNHCAECCFGTGVVAANADEHRMMCVCRDAAGEIVQLRADNKRLQGLIDAYVAARRERVWDGQKIAAAWDALTQEADGGS